MGIGTNRGGTAKADLKHIEKGLIHIEAELRSKGHPTSQTVNTGKNRRTFNNDENGEEKCNICHRTGHTTKECKSPCWSQSRNRNRQKSSSRTRDEKNKPRRNSPANQKKKKRDPRTPE